MSPESKTNTDPVLQTADEGLIRISRIERIVRHLPGGTIIADALNPILIDDQSDYIVDPNDYPGGF